MDISTREYTLLMNYRTLSDADKNRIDTIINVFVASMPCARKRKPYKCDRVRHKKRLIGGIYEATN